MNTIKISVIVPIYNAELYLEKCLSSILLQTLKEIEIICVNDGSTDNSLSILNKFSEKDSRMIVINTKNRGVSVARNIGISRARGGYLFFVDDDDWLELDCLKEMYGIAEKSQAEIVITNTIYNYTDGTNELIKQPIKYNKCLSHDELEEYFYTFFREGKSQGAIWNSLYKASLIKGRINFIPRELIGGEDYLFKINALLDANNVIVTKAAYYNYRVLPDSQSRKIISFFNSLQILNVVIYLGRLMEKATFSGDNWIKYNFSCHIVLNILSTIRGGSFKTRYERTKCLCSLQEIKKYVVPDYYKKMPVKKKIAVELYKNGFAFLLALLI